MELVLRPRRGKLVFLVVGGLTFVGTAIFMLKSPPDFWWQSFVGWGGIVFFGLCAALGIMSLWPDATYLKLNDQGFTMCGMFRTRSYLWSEVGTFKVRRMVTQNMVALDFTENYRRSPSLRKINTRVAGFEGALPNLYSRSPEELATTMNEWRQRAGY
jgi:hypothetical protein